MIQGDIVADDLGPGTDNPARVVAIRNRLSQLHPDGIPFLLLPVRIETRFMRVDRPTTTPPPSGLSLVDGLRTQLQATATRDFATDLKAGKRKNVKAAELDHARFLDGAVDAISKARLPAIAALRSSSAFSHDDPTQLRAAAASLMQSYAAALASVGRLRSPHQRDAYAKALQTVKAEVIDPIEAEITRAAAPKLDLLASLRKVPANAAIDAMRATRTALTAADPRPTPTRIAQKRDALISQLRNLRTLAHGVLQGTPAELDALRAEWESLAADAQRFAATARSLPAVGQSAGVARAPVDDVLMGELLPDLASLGGGPARTFEVLTNLRLERSARAATEADAEMTALLALLATPALPAPRGADQALGIAAKAVAAARRIDALMRDVAILPRDRYLAGVSRVRQAVAAVAPWHKVIADLAARGEPNSQVLARDADAAFAALQGSVLSQRTDAWDAYAAPLDVVRRKAFAIATTATETVDELWVRIFPDDIAIHTHEPALTENEKIDGASFWAETKAAGNDDALKRGAWKALAQRHGSPRASWIAKTLAPTPPQMAVAAAAPASPDFIAAVETLHRRMNDRGSRPAAIERARAAHLKKMIEAADAAVEAGRSAPAFTTRQKERLDNLLSALRGSLTGIAGRLARRARFAEEWENRESEIETLRQKLEEIEALAARTGAVDPHPAMRAELAAADAPTKDGPWTQAPHSPVLPERFVVVAVTGERVVHTVAGNTVGDVKVGLDPSPNAAGETFALDEDGNLVVGDSIRWMVDFNEAVAKGLGVRIPITTAQAASGFDELLVIGVREASAADSLTLVQNLVENHHYTAGGMAFLPIGSPTNNTEAEAAAHRSDDDPDKTYDIERGAPLFDVNPPSPFDQADGFHFARACGLDPAIVAHLAEAGGRGVSEARIMNEALWPATIGPYLEEFLPSLVSSDTARRLRAFFRENVSARGWIPAFRIGQQPYGVLTTTAFSQFVPDGGDVLPTLPATGPAGLSEADKQKRFDILLRDLIAAAAADWSRIRAAKVKHVHSPGVTDPQRHFMEILGLAPVSVGAEYRFAVNVGSRHPAPSATRPELLFGYSGLGPSGLLERFDAFLRRAYGLPAGPLMNKGLVTAPFRAFFELLSDERVYSVRLIDRVRSLGGAVSGSTGASYAAGLLNRPVAALVDDARRRQGASTALLFLLLRQALIAQVLNSTLNILEIENMLTADARRRAGAADEFLVRTLVSDVFATKWSYVFGALPALDGRFDVHFPKGTGTLFTYLTTGMSRTMADYLASRGDNPVFNGFAGRTRHFAERTELQNHANRVSRVGAIAPARLDALVREHLDLCSHRLDAWQLGEAVRRLGTMRAKTPGGVFLGAYGWIENLRPKSELPIAEALPPALHRDGEPAVFADPTNEGFVHTPSVSHAVTAAILRSAYLTETNEPDVENAMAINLSSRRVRLALDLLDGVEAGNDLGALLGYELERELHEAFATEHVSFDALIFELRRQYPGKAGVDPATSTPDTARRQVVDGLSLLNAVRQWVEANVPPTAQRDRTLFEILVASATATLPLPADALDAQHRGGIFRALDSLADALDAIGDLVLSESIFQIVRGNFPRAAAVIAALAEGKPVPRPQIVRTPRSGTAVTHRVLLPLKRFDGRSLSSILVTNATTLAAARAAALPPEWSTPMTMTARANAEPGLNHWLGSLLDDPGRIICRYQDPATGSGTKQITAKQLGLQPLDLLAMLGSGLEDGVAELAARIVYFTMPAQLDLGATLAAGPLAPLVLLLEDRGTTWTAADRSFGEVEPLIVEAQSMLRRARAAQRSDLLFTEIAADPSTGAATFDTAELSARVEEGRTRLRALGLDLMKALAGGPPTDDIDTIDPAAWAATHSTVFNDPTILRKVRDLGRLALRAADFGITVALPPIRFETANATVAELRAAVVNAFVQVVTRMHEAKAAADAQDLQGTGSAIFGRSFTIAPQFALPDAATIRAQLASAELLRAGDAFSMDDWLVGVAAVREPVAALRRTWMLGEAFGAAPPAPKPAQLPAQAGDAWLGLPFPSGYQPTSDKLSLVFLTNPWGPTDPTVSAVLVDQWTETIPSRTETTGVAFNYDSPDSMPPQSLLLAVPPVVRGTWRWDDLVLTLHDTLEIARNRTVEAEHLAGEVYTQLLPAITGELVPDQPSGSAEVTGSRVILDFGINNAAMGG
jgi:hypothetical protein